MLHYMKNGYLNNKIYIVKQKQEMKIQIIYMLRMVLNINQLNIFLKVQIKFYLILIKRENI